MSIRVEIEGGTTLEFPDGTSDSIIDATAKRYLQPDKPEKKGIGWLSDTLSNIGTGMSKMAQSESTGARATQESVGNIASGALAWIPAGLYGASKLYSDTALKGVKGTDYGAIKQDVNSIQNALTYSPKGEQGKLLAETLTSPLTAVSNKFIEGAEYSKKQAEKAAQAGDLETAKKWLAAEYAAEFGSEAWMFALPGIFKGAKVARGIPKKLSLKSLEGIIPEEVAKGDYAVTPDVREQLATKKPLVVEQKPVVPVIKEAPVVQAVKPVAKPRQKNEFRPPDETLKIDGIKKTQKRTDILDEIEKDARELSKTDQVAGIPVKDYKLNFGEQQHLLQKGITFDVDRMGNPLVRLSQKARIEELRNAVNSKRANTEITAKGRLYLDEIGKKKKEIDTAFANEQDVLADKAVEEFDKAQVQTPAPPKETKVIPTTKKAEANVVSPKEQKTYVLDKLNNQINKAREYWRKSEDAPTELTDTEIDNKILKKKYSDGLAPEEEKIVIIKVPNDGQYKIENNLGALLRFQKKFKQLDISNKIPDRKTPMPSKKPTGKPIEEIQREAWDEYIKVYEQYRDNGDIQQATELRNGIKEYPELYKDLVKNEEARLKQAIEQYHYYTDKVIPEYSEKSAKFDKILKGVNNKEITLKSLSTEFRGKTPSLRDLNEAVGTAYKNLSDAENYAADTKKTIDKYNQIFKTNEPKGVTLTSGIDPTQIMPVLRSLSESTSQFIKKYETPPEIKKGVQSAIKSMVDHHRLNREAEFLSQQLKKVVNDVVPNPERQMFITHAVEHKLQGKYFDQLNEIEKGVARWATGENQKLRQFLEKNGAIELLPDTNSVTHVYHWWINEKTGEPYSPMYGRFSKGAPQGKKRTIPTYEYGMLKGQKPATTNIGELIGLEWESATRANSANKLFQSLHEIKGDSSTVIKRSPKGSPQQIRLIESWSSLEQQGLTNGYKRYSSPFLNKAKTHIADDGRLVTMKGDVGIKEELYPHVRAYLESPTYGKLSEIAFAAKNLKLAGTLFHVVSLGMQELANLRMPFVHVPKGLKLRQELGPGMKLLHSEGLEVLKGYEDFGGKGNLFRGEHPAIKYANIAAKPLTIFRDFTFDIVQPGMKMSMADFLLNKYLPKYMEKTGWSAEQVMKAYEKGEKMPPAIETRMRQCAREVVQKVDGHFSGEDYKRGLLETNRFMADLYFSPEAKKFWQIALLSPTWQREHLLVAKNVAKSFMPNSLIKKLGMSEMGPIKGAYRRYALGAALMISAVDMWNYMSTGVMDGKSVHMWDNPEGKKFGVRAWWNEPAYIDYNKDGERIYHPPARAYIRPLKSVFEVAEGSTNIVHKVSNKLAPPPKAIGEQFFGSKKYGGTTDMPNRAKDFMLDLALPMMANQVIMAAQGKQSAKAALLPFVGMPVSREKTKTKNLK